MNILRRSGYLKSISEAEEFLQCVLQNRASTQKEELREKDNCEDLNH